MGIAMKTTLGGLCCDDAKGRSKGGEGGVLGRRAMLDMGCGDFAKVVKGG